MSAKKWTTDENEHLMTFGFKLPWPEIAADLDRTEAACKAHYEKIRKLRIVMGTWKGI